MTLKIAPPLTGTKKYSRSFLTIILAFILSRIVYHYYFGIRFDATPINWYWQYIDPYLLKTDLLRSVYYLHSQPPLFNIFLGVILKLFPNNYALVFQLIYLALGPALAASLFFIMVKLRVPDKLSAILAIIFIINPSVILYENLLFYEYPIVTILALSVVFLIEFLANGRFRDAVIFFALLAILVLMRNIYSMYYFLLVLLVLILILYKKYAWKKILLAGLVPFLIIFTVAAKYFFLYHSFTMGTIFFEQNFNQAAVSSISHMELQVLTDYGDISPLSKIGHFRPLSKYKQYVNIPATGIPILDSKYKLKGSINIHNLAYVDISKKLLKDALYIMGHYPKKFFKNIMRRFAKNYFLLASDIFWDNYYNPMKIESVSRVFNRIIYLQLSIGRPSLFLVVSCPVLILYAFYLVFKMAFNKTDELVTGPTAAIMLINILMVSAAALLLPFEHSRFRFEVDPFYLVLLGLLIRDAYRKIWDKFQKNS